MKNDDKGLLEDLIGESLEETATKELHAETDTTQTAVSGGGGKDRDLQDLFADHQSEPSIPDHMGDESDQSVIEELVQIRPRRGNGMVIVLGLVLVGLLGFGIAVKRGYLKLPIPKFIYDPNQKIDITQVKDKSGKLIVKAPIPSRDKIGNPPPPGVAPNQVVSKPLNPVQVPSAPPPAVVPQNTVASAPPQVAPSVVSKPVQTQSPQAVVPQVPPPQTAPVTQPPVQAQPKVAVSKPKPEIKTRPVSAPPPKKVEPVQAQTEEATIPTTPTTKSTGNGAYRIQIGAYLFKASLKDPMNKVSSLGLKPHLAKTQRSVKMYQVLVGHFQNRETAQAAVKDLLEENIKAKIVSRPKGKFAALAGSYFYAKEAQHLKQHLDEFGYEVEIEKGPVMSDLHELYVGNYATKEAAETDLARLKSKGLNPVIAGP